MTPLCPRPALGSLSSTSWLRSVFKDARGAAPRGEAAGPLFRPLSSTRRPSRGGCRASNVGRLAERGEAGSAAAAPRAARAVGAGRPPLPPAPAPGAAAPGRARSPCACACACAPPLGPPVGGAVAFSCGTQRPPRLAALGLVLCPELQKLGKAQWFPISQTRFARRVSSPKFERRLPSQPGQWARPGRWAGRVVAGGRFKILAGALVLGSLVPLLLSFLPFCPAMPCSEATPAISPSKRARPAEDGMRLRFVRLSEHATAPTKGSPRAAGYDLYSAYDYILPPMEKAIVKTDIQVALPSGCYGRVAGVIDEDYRGNVGVVLFNFGKEKFEVKKGDRIAQLICERIFYPEIEEVQVLDDTERGSGGFGSTGKN
uniref:Deoxyuridine 5'-triphosphate nucleotidohydrolase n=1 Tax=Canis lupus familiaris TaxID=9615 RepID=A0A8C0MTM1_CANLF